MQYLYSPWRGAYLQGKEKKCECIFCHLSKVEVGQEWVFYKDEICYGVLNAYPYTPAHFMFIPHKHVDSPHLLEEKEWLHISKKVLQGVSMLYEFGADGINTGINIKEAGGAGIPQHLHWHILPRFKRDTNFMTAIAECRIYGCDFEEIFNTMLALAKKYLK